MYLNYTECLYLSHCYFFSVDFMKNAQYKAYRYYAYNNVMMKKEHMNNTKQTLSIATATIFHSSRITASFSLTGEICLAPPT